MSRDRKPSSRYNTLWLNLTIHFGLRSGKEQRELWGDVKLKQTPDLSILLPNGKPKVEQSSVKLKMYDGSIMRPIGEHNDSYHTLKFQVFGSPNKPLLSAESCEMLGLSQFNLNIPQDVHVAESTPKPPLSPKMLC